MVDHQIQHFSDYQKRCLFFVPIYLFIYLFIWPFQDGMRDRKVTCSKELL